MVHVFSDQVSDLKVQALEFEGWIAGYGQCLLLVGIWSNYAYTAVKE